MVIVAISSPAGDNIATFSFVSDYILLLLRINPEFDCMQYNYRIIDEAKSSYPNMANYEVKVKKLPKDPYAGDGRPLFVMEEVAVNLDTGDTTTTVFSPVLPTPRRQRDWLERAKNALGIGPTLSDKGAGHELAHARGSGALRFGFQTRRDDEHAKWLTCPQGRKSLQQMIAIARAPGEDMGNHDRKILDFLLGEAADRKSRKR